MRAPSPASLCPLSLDREVVQVAPIALPSVGGFHLEALVVACQFSLVTFPGPAETSKVFQSQELEEERGLIPKMWVRVCNEKCPGRRNCLHRAAEESCRPHQLPSSLWWHERVWLGATTLQITPQSEFPEACYLHGTPQTNH